MTDDQSTYREILEADYDRPSFHCEDWGHRVIGTMSAIMEQHQALAHRPGGSFMWHDGRCHICGFDAAGTFQEAFPELADINQHRGSGRCSATMEADDSS